ncbi:hypothetical protein [Herbaspirillum sp. RV1423]|uniref:hypothetical protein n=1 Tax=Herbaspirillum sp. RV1423 TaxID=1443993 RepID=UPI0004AEE072|nr:hypothetical protein [Herbaspirillum sp. RV1423]
MKINTSSDMPFSAYAIDAGNINAVAGADGQAPLPTDKVTVSDAARKLAEGLSELASAIATIPSPMPERPPSQSVKKKAASALSPMLDIDAFRLIRDKLRSRNLGLKEQNPEERKDREAKVQSTKI